MRHKIDCRYEVKINGCRPTNTDVKSVKTNFNLTQCFCSCSLRCAYPHHLIGNHWIEVEEHYDDCPNADPDRFVRYLN